MTRTATDRRIDAKQGARAYARARTLQRGAPLTRRLTQADAFYVAREMFLNGERVEMRALARKIGVSRATLYRWVGDRERLLAEVLWSSHGQLVDWLKTKKELRGVELITSRVEAYIHVVSSSQPLRQLLRREPEIAFRILTRRGTGIGIQERAVDDLARLIEHEQRHGNYAPSLAPHTLAYAIVRIIEGFIYNDLIAGIEPDVKGAGQVIRALL